MLRRRDRKIAPARAFCTRGGSATRSEDGVHERGDVTEPARCNEEKGGQEEHEEERREKELLASCKMGKKCPHRVKTRHETRGEGCPVFRRASRRRFHGFLRVTSELPTTSASTECDAKKASASVAVATIG